jgi:suppressor for copper-sensitivity B
MKYRLFLALISLMFLPLQAVALSSDWQRDNDAGVRLISAVDAVGQDAAVTLGLEIQMAPEWHTYWRSPGMAGIPPQIEFSPTDADGLGNLKSSHFLFPAPKRYTAYGLETVGYHDHIILPLVVQLETPGRSLTLNGKVNLLICSSICVPKSFDVKLKIPEGNAVESAEAKLINEYKNLLPTDATVSGIAIRGIVNNSDGLAVSIESRDALVDPDIFVENDVNTGFAAPTVTIDDDHRGAQLKIKLADNLPAGTSLAGMKLVLTIVNDGHALEQKIVVPPVTADMTFTAEKRIPFVLAILFAVIGGFILNLMPCVLPVLSLKIFSAIGHGGGEINAVRRSFLMTAAGILFSFLVLSAVTIGLKSVGMTLGWGVQFQQPVFLLVLIFLLTLFAANMWGLFEIQLPSWLADKVGTAAYHPKLAGDFATGAFATLLATPCSAPFLGTAIGFALAGGAAEIIGIFGALGFGMIIPYLLVAAFPRFATALPKPGAWMNVLRAILGLALAVTAVWLVWVLSSQITSNFAALVGLSMTGIVIMLGFLKTKVSKKIIAVGLLIFCLVPIVLTLVGPRMPKPMNETERLWIPFSTNALAADIQEGKTVFVDVTADWCLTCKANKQFILMHGDVYQRLFHSDVVAMQADWTNPDPVITDFLHKYNRYGIPFNIVYGPGAEQGIPLPEILTHDTVVDAITKASGVRKE